MGLLRRFAELWFSAKVEEESDFCKELKDTIDTLEARLEKQRVELRSLYPKIRAQNLVIQDLLAKLDGCKPKSRRLWKRFRRK